MSTDERIKLVREATQTISAMAARGDQKATQLALARRDMLWPEVLVILDEREAEREVVEAATKLRSEQFEYEGAYSSLAEAERVLDDAVRRLLEVRSAKQGEVQG